MQDSFQSGVQTNTLFLLLQVPIRHKVKENYPASIDLGGKGAVLHVDKWQRQKLILPY